LKLYYTTYYTTTKKGSQIISVSPYIVWLPIADSNHGQGD
jgi:hypothetical protein